MSSNQQARSGGGALDFLEETFQLLRWAPPSLLVSYYLGSVPFVIGFLYFWTDMSRSAFAHERLPRSAWILTLLFVWMKAWQGVFASSLHEQVSGRSVPPWNLSRFGRALVVQTAVQPSAFFLLPIAFAITLPFGWAYAFYQNVTVFSSSADRELIAVCRKASQQAQLWPGQNHAVLAVLLLFGCVVFLNVGIVLYAIPQLLKSLLGIETRFSQSQWGLLNTTFLVATLGCTYLLVDPLVKAVYVLRCFHGQAIQTGDDLRVMLRSLPKAAAVVCAVLLGLCLFATAVSAADIRGQHKNPPKAPSSNPIAAEAVPNPGAELTAAATTVPVDELDRAIREVISQREYSWRLPRVKADREKQEGLIARLVGSLLETLQNWSKACLKVARDVIRWIVEAIFKRLAPHHAPSAGTGWVLSLPVLLYGLLALVGCALAIVLLRVWKRPGANRGQVLAEPIASTPDLADQDVLADQLPEESWLKLAAELAERGELRLALRAFYLAGLAHLGQRQIIRIAKFKSNCDYQKELCRRVPAETALQTSFSELIAAFDRVWYGLNEVNADVLAQFRLTLERVILC